MNRTNGASARTRRGGWASALAVALAVVWPSVSAADETIEEHLTALADLFEAGEYAAAVELVEGATADHGDARLRLWLVRGLYELEEYEEAVEAAEQVVNLQPSDSESHRWLGKCYGRLAERKKSFLLARKVKKHFAEAVELDGSNLRARRDLMQFLVKAPFVVGGSKSAARVQAEAISALDPVEGHLAWAYYLRKTDDLAGTRQRYNQMMALLPELGDPYFEMADFGAESGNGEFVARALAGAESTVEGDPRLDYYRGVAAVLTGSELEEGSAALARYLAETPKSSELPPHAERTSGLEMRGRPAAMP